MRSLSLGWLVIVAVVAPVIGAYFLIGEAVLLLYIALLIFVVLCMLAVAIGDIVLSYRR